MSSPIGDDVIWVKDPADTTGYLFNWGTFLVAGETITSFTVAPAAGSGVTKTGQASTPTTVVIEVSGGTVGVDAVITCNITTSLGNVYQAEKIIYLITRTS